MHRGYIAIISAVLEASLEGAIKTAIMHRANLDSRQFNTYSEFLRERNLLETTDNNTRYKTTERGLSFLKNVHSMKNLLTKEK